MTLQFDFNAARERAIENMAALITLLNKAISKHKTNFSNTLLTVSVDDQEDLENIIDALSTDILIIGMAFVHGDPGIKAVTQNHVIPTFNPEEKE